MSPYLSIDVETTGLDADTCQLLEVAAVYEDRSGREIDDLPTFRAVFMRDRIEGDAYALQMNAELIRQIATDSVAPVPGDDVTDVMLTRPDSFVFEFGSWLAEHCGHDKIVVAGKNFWKLDYPFLKSELPNGWFEKRVSHRAYDPGNMMCRPGQPIPSLVKCLYMVGKDARDLHTAVGDARDVIEVIRYWESINVA